MTALVLVAAVAAMAAGSMVILGIYLLEAGGPRR